jgi:hypothetical protein
MNLYCLYDILAEEAGPVFEAANDKVAVRNVRQMLAKSGQKESEYDLYVLGSYDSKLPKILVDVPPKVIDLGIVPSRYEEFLNAH